VHHHRATGHGADGDTGRPQGRPLGRKLIFLAGFAVLPIRGVLYTLAQKPYALVSIQVLDGIGAGIFGALFLLSSRT